MTPDVSRFLLTDLILPRVIFLKPQCLFHKSFLSIRFESLTGNYFGNAHVHLHLYATHETCRVPIHLRFSRKIRHRPPRGRTPRFISLSSLPRVPFSPRDTGLRLISPRGKTSGTEFKFHKLVCPLHPRRNRGRLISPVRILRSSFLARHADGSWKAWVPSLYSTLLYQPAGQDRITIWMPTNHNAGASQISPRDPRLGSSSRRDPSCFNRALLANPSWISPRWWKRDRIAVIVNARHIATHYYSIPKIFSKSFKLRHLKLKNLWISTIIVHD